MKLDAYIRKHNIKALDFAHAIEISPGYLSKLRSGKHIPDLLVCQRIERHTERKVRPQDFYPDET